MIMGASKYKPHILVLPEDDANRQIANGFVLDPNLNERVIQILPSAGGWSKVLNEFKTIHVSHMKQYPERRIVLIMDFDDMPQDRLGKLQAEVPEELTDRVFILGVLSEPEKLKANIRKSYEDIGKSLSHECSDNIQILWRHDLLKHNENELYRMVKFIKPFLFN